MKKILSMSVAVALILLAFIPGTAIAQSTGVISGTVVNGTPGGPSIGSIPISLRSLRRTSVVAERVGEADTQGRFRFEGLDTSSDLQYLVSAGYLNVAYNSSAINLTSGSASVEVKAYEITTDDDAISISKGSLAITNVDAALGLVGVLEVVSFVNSGDRTYVGDLFTNSKGGGVLDMPLPQSTLDVALAHGFEPDGALGAPFGIRSKTPLAPGEGEYIIAYTLPYFGREIEIDKVYAYKVNAMSVLMPTSAGKIASPQLNGLGQVDISGRSHYLLSGPAMDAGTPITISLTELVEHKIPTDSSSIDKWLRYAGVGAMVALAGAILYFALVLRKRKPALADGAAPAQRTSLEKEQDDLLQSIAALDDELAAGKLTKDDHERQRAAKKRRLMDVALLLKEKGAKADK